MNESSIMQGDAALDRAEKSSHDGPLWTWAMAIPLWLVLQNVFVWGAVEEDSSLTNRFRLLEPF